VHKLRAILLEGSNGVEGEFIVGGDLLRGAWDNPRGDGFIGFGKVFNEGVGNGEEVGLEVFGVIGDYDRGWDDGGKGFGGEVAAKMVSTGTLCPFSRAGSGSTYVCFRWRLVKLVLTVLYWLYLLLTSLSMLTISWEAGSQ